MNVHYYEEKWTFDRNHHYHECTLCGRNVKAAKHTVIILHAKEATTSQEGYSGDQVCESCGYVVAKGEILPVKSVGKVSPKTGDSESIMIWLTWMVIAGMSIIGIKMYKRAHH